MNYHRIKSVVVKNYFTMQICTCRYDGGREVRIVLTIRGAKLAKIMGSLSLDIFAAKIMRFPYNLLSTEYLLTIKTSHIVATKKTLTNLRYYC